MTALLAAPAFADEFADVSKLVRGGQYSDAMSKVDAFLVQRPRDPQMRFLKGIILTEQNKSTEAIAVFTKLTEDFPDLPEPYNNLAVLFASSNQYEKSRAALEMAIRTNPTYATAHENLGDVYAKLASQAYDKALQLDSSNTAAKSKLTLVRTLIGNTTGGTNPKIAAAQIPTAAPAAAKTAPPALTAAVVAQKKEPAKVEPIPETKPAASSDGEHEEVLGAVNGWAKAWSSRDVKSYLNFYSNDFQTPNHESRKAWSEERRARIEGKGSITVKVDAPQVTINGNTATVKFRQGYISDRLTANSRKTLVLEKQGGKWQIKQERAGS